MNEAPTKKAAIKQAPEKSRAKWSKSHVNDKFTRLFVFGLSARESKKQPAAGGHLVQYCADATHAGGGRERDYMYS